MATFKLEDLLGRRVQRLDSPAPDLLSLVLSAAGSEKQVLIARIRGQRVGFGLVDERPKGDAASPAISKLRRHVQGALVQQIGLSPERHLHCTLARGTTSVVLELSFAERTGNCLVYAENGRPLVRLHREAPPARSQLPPAIDGELDLRAAGQSLLSHSPQQGGDPERQRFEQALRRRLTSVRRRLKHIEADAARGQEVDTLRQLATQILSQLRTAQVTANQVGIESPEPPHERVWLELAPQQTPQALADKLFDKARRFERGSRIAAERARMTQAEITALEALLQRSRSVEPLSAEQWMEITDQARTLGARGLARAPQATRASSTRTMTTSASTRLPYREFQSRDGLRILVGRGARDNDMLTLHYARPSDLFLHARGCPGAHVIVPLPRDRSCPADTLVDAATLAAHFSKLHREPLVDVCYTSKRHVRKPKGAPPGQVLLQQEKVLTLRVDTALLERLSHSERSQ